MAIAHPTNVSDTSEDRPPRLPTLLTWLAVLCGAGTMLVVSFLMSRGPRSEGSVRLSYRQSPGNGDALRFELPAGWWIKYNGHQPWRGGTVADAMGRPRIEVWLCDEKGPDKPGAELCEFRWGRTACRTRWGRTGWPFCSFPGVGRPNGSVVERTFVLARGSIAFSVLENEDAVLKPIIWACMNSLRPDGEAEGRKP